MAILEVHGAEIHYEVTGNGDTLVLVPGFASGAWSWEWQAEALSTDFRVITFDPRGIARSQVHDGAGISIPVIADDIASLLDHLNIQRANVLGISFGGFVAQEFALRYPERLGKLVLASTSFGGPNHVAPPIEVLTAFSSTDGLNSADRIRRYITTAFTPNFAREHNDVVDRFCELRENNLVPETIYRQQLASAMSFNTEEQISTIQAPTLVITGADDTIVPPQNSYNLLERLDNAEMSVIEKAGHMAFVESASEFNRIIKEFLLANSLKSNA